MDTAAFSEREVDLALGHRVRIAVGEGVMNQLVHVAADQIGVALET
jgi:hypothetical protein